MKLIIIDKFGNNKTFNTPMIVPRVGDQINWFHSPAPRVKVVNINYETDEVTALVE